MATPGWALALLVEEMPALRAADKLDWSVASTLPHMEGRDRERLIDRLRSRAELPAPRKRYRVKKRDPAAAQQWFEERGIIVRNENESGEL